jgi:disulfide bond formation protein DsbB
VTSQTPGGARLDEAFARLDDSRFGWARRLALALPMALLGGALGSQYLGGLVPCEMCHWQRWPHYAALPVALAALLLAPGTRARILTIAAALLIATSGAIGVYHAGVEAGWWQGATACTSTGAVTLDDIFAAPLTRCDEVQFRFAGISMAGWNAILSLGGAALIGWLARARDGDKA